MIYIYRYMDIKVTHIRCMDVGRYKYNYEGFCEKFIYPISINKGKIIITQEVHARLLGIISFLLFLSQ